MRLIGSFWSAKHCFRSRITPDNSLLIFEIVHYRMLYILIYLLLKSSRFFKLFFLFDWFYNCFRRIDSSISIAKCSYICISLNSSAQIYMICSEKKTFGKLITNSTGFWSFSIYPIQKVFSAVVLSPQTVFDCYFWTSFDVISSRKTPSFQRWFHFWKQTEQKGTGRAMFGKQRQTYDFWHQIKE